MTDRDMTEPMSTENPYVFGGISGSIQNLEENLLRSCRENDVVIGESLTKELEDAITKAYHLLGRDQISEKAEQDQINTLEKLTRKVEQLLKEALTQYEP